MIASFRAASRDVRRSLWPQIPKWRRLIYQQLPWDKVPEEFGELYALMENGVLLHWFVVPKEFCHGKRPKTRGADYRGAQAQKAAQATGGR